MKGRIPLLALTAVVCAAAGFGIARERVLTGTPVPRPQRVPGLALDTAWTGLREPVHLAAPEGDSRVFIVEQEGRIRLVRQGVLQDQPWLDISARVGSGGERGLLGLAFHPDFARNGRFFVDYTDRHGDTHVAEFHAGPSADQADPDSEKQLLFVRQPYANHNGGHVLFGPDGRLYVGMGDGGSGGDPHNNGQKRDAQLGKILRIDVDGGRVETWAIGMRNPWRLAFGGGSLYVADVGQNAWEEIDVQPDTARDLNYGWRIMEGSHCFRNPVCSRDGLVMPAVEYDHGQGCSVIGGVVYRGSAIPALAGHYLYSDYCSSWLRSFRFERGTVQDPREWDIPRIGAVTSFGEDGAHNVYLLTVTGTIYRIVPAR